MPADFPEELSAHSAFNLVMNPFEPVVRINGQEARYRYSGSGPLKPQECAEHLLLYFNIYDWKDEHKLKGIGADGRLIVLQRPNDDRSMVILISGFRGSGRTSALNLLKYEIAARSLRPPIAIEYNATITANQNQHAREIALILLRAVRRAGLDPLAGRLAETQKDWAAAVGDNAGSPETLFAMFKDDIADLASGLSVVITLDAQDHKVTSDVWRPICRMLSRVADFVIVSLSDHDQAQHFRNNLELGEFQVAWVDAPKVTKDRIMQFLSHRLSKERVEPARVHSPLSPFTPEALQVLFRAIGGNKAEGTMPIAVAMSRLTDVFRHKAQALLQDIKNGVALTVDSVQISGQDMEKYLDDLAR